MSSPVHSSEHLTPGKYEHVPMNPLAPIAPDDWNILFNAVKTRLRMLAESMTSDSASTAAPYSNDRLRGALLLDCVEALDWLQAAAPAARTDDTLPVA